MANAIENTNKKIDGYDKYDVESAVSTMRRAEEIKADSKFLKVVIKEMNREAGKLEDTANLLVKTSKKLNEVFGNKK